jgi:hypothetical protein|tara:strand:- start:9 stop:419 length:411 start_codon:yes stop_codon:yes gene_type:complete
VVLQYGDNVTTALEALRSISDSIHLSYYAIPHSDEDYEQLALLNCLDNGDMHQKKLVCEIITNVLMKEAESAQIDFSASARGRAEVLAQSLKKNGFLDILEQFETETMRWFGLAMMCIETNGTCHTSPPPSPYHGN